MDTKKRVVITGATGFIGGNLSRRLLQEGHDVHLLVRSGYNPWRIANIRNKIKIHEVNFLNKANLDSVISKIRPQWIFHLAAYGAYPEQNDLGHMIQTNLTNTTNLINACLKTGFEVFINTGTSSEYGFKKNVCPETECLEPNSYYAITKASATLFCRYTARNHNVHIPTLRLYSVYGPFEEPTRLIPRLILHGLNGKLPPLVDPDIARDFVYIDDVIEAYILTATTPLEEYGSIYNVGTGFQTTIRKAVEVTIRLMNITDEPKWSSMPNRHWDTNFWVADNRKIKEKLGWQPRHTFEEGFRKTIDWFHNNPKLLIFYQKKINHDDKS